jgi:alanine-glyoxylate transaminase/serine-glyoxylate transaminase/serine-pyruvate transaminase
MSPGRHFLQIPGPTNVPDRVLRAISQPTIDHRGPAFARLTSDVLDGLRRMFKTSGAVVIYPSSGTGALEAALVNTLSPDDRILMFEIGQFATLWRNTAAKLGLDVDFVCSDWRRGVDPDVVAAKLREDRGHAIKAVAVVHNETSTGVTSRIADVRRVIDLEQHPALLLVDTISSLGSIDYRHDEWRVDVSITGSQKGLMLPPGLGFHAVSDKALAASKNARLPRSYWDWEAMIANSKAGFPYTPAINMLFGLREAVTMLEEEGLDRVFARHARHGEATRRAVRAWGLDLVCVNPAEYSNSVTAVMSRGHRADRFRTVVGTFDMSLGTGLGKLKAGSVDSATSTSCSPARAGVEWARTAGVPFTHGGITSALTFVSGGIRDRVCHLRALCPPMHGTAQRRTCRHGARGHCDPSCANQSFAQLAQTLRYCWQPSCGHVS